MAVSKAVVSRARILAITHILVGVLLIVFGMADCATPSYNATFNSGLCFFGTATGIWMCIAGGLGILGSTPQRTQRRNVFAAIFMGFAITSAVLGGTIIIWYSTTTGSASCEDYCYYYYNCNNYGYHGYYGNCTKTPGFLRKPWYSYDTKVGLGAVILTLGIIEFGTGIWVSICLCVMKPCCTDPEERGPLSNSVTG